MWNIEKYRLMTKTSVQNIRLFIGEGQDPTKTLSTNMKNIK
jgi:hypothetical protein